MDYAGTWITERPSNNQTRDGKLRGARSNPTRKRCATVALRKFLARHGLRMPVYAIVVFTSPNARLSADGPRCPSRDSTLYQIMRRDYLTDDRITPQMAQQTVSAIVEG